MQATIRTHFAYFITIFALAFAVYFNSLHNDFNLDDNAIIKDNSLVRSLSNLPRMLVSNYWANTPYEEGVLLYRPLVMATFAVDYAIWGNNPFGFHLANALINSVNAVLVMVLLGVLFGDKIPQFPRTLCALLFAFHPVHTEAINMVVGRTELLAAMFGLLTFILYVKGRASLALGSFFLAMVSKEIAVTVPILIFVYERLFGRKIETKKYGLFAAMVALYLLIRFSVLHGLVSVHQTGILDGQTAFQRALTVIKVLGYYLRLLVLPFPLTPDYSDVPLPRSFLESAVVVPLLSIALLLFCAWKCRVRWPMITFGIIWFFVAILPVSNVISIGAFLGERFLYLPSVGGTLVAAGVCCYSSDTRLRAVVLAACMLVSIGFGAMTVWRNADWKDANCLWQKVLDGRPENPRANYRIGAKFDEQKDYQHAIIHYEKAIQFFPGHNWNPDHKTVLTVKERLSAIYYILALRLYKANRFEDSMAYCRRAIENNEKNAAAYVVMGNVYVQQDELKKAAEAYESALRADPDQFEAKENLKRIGSLLPGR